MAKFPTEARLRQSVAFTAAFAVRPRRSSHFSLYVRENGLNQARLGLIISKRFYKHAIHRNLVKRIAREVFRAYLPYLKAVDILLRLNKKFALDKVSSRKALKVSCFLEIKDLIARIDKTLLMKESEK